MSLKEIADEGVMIVSEAKNDGKLKKADWDKAKAKNGLAGLKEKCCIYIKKKQGTHFMCLVDNESKTCETLTINWVTLLNAYSAKLNFLEDQDEMKETAAGMDCDDPKMKLVSRRLVNVAHF